MARNTKWCQNPKCPEKKNSNQIRGSKGSKYYQSNPANGYGNGNFCTLSCYDEWSNIYLDRAIDAIGARITEPVKVNMENAWEVNSEYVYNRGDDTRSRYIYFLTNKLFNNPSLAINTKTTTNNGNLRFAHKLSFKLTVV